MHALQEQLAKLWYCFSFEEISQHYSMVSIVAQQNTIKLCQSVRIIHFKCNVSVSPAGMD